jgi:hypothetical protein
LKRERERVSLRIASGEKFRERLQLMAGTQKNILGLKVPRHCPLVLLVQVDGIKDTRNE